MWSAYFCCQAACKGPESYSVRATNSAFAARDVIHLIPVSGVAIYPGDTKLIGIEIPIDFGICPTDGTDCVCHLWSQDREARQDVIHPEAPLPPTFVGMVGPPLGVVRLPIKEKPRN